MNREEIHTSTAITDEEIIARILTGEKQLYSVLVKKYNQRLYRIGMAIIHDDNETEDAMQTAYINAYENLGKFAFRSSFATWLTRILINECLLRIKKRKKILNMNDDTMEKAIQEQQNGTAGTPVSTLLNAELRSVLEKAIHELPEIYRSVFVMRELEDMNVAETGECLDISEVNVKVRLNRSKAMLRKILSPYYKKEEILHFHLTRCDRMVDAVMKKICSLS